MVAISFHNVHKSYRAGYKKKSALHPLDLEIKAGEIFGFLGPNGAGKSTSIKLLLQFIRPDAGEIFVNRTQVGKERFHHYVGYLPEIPCFYENLSGLETLWFAGKASGMSKKKIQERSKDVLQRVELFDAGKQLIRTYSKGMKQRLGLAVALIHEPPIYIFDEPMSGLDPMGRRLVTDIILELRELGKTVFFSSHILSDVERLCDRIGILNQGRLLFCGSVAEFAADESDLEEAFVRLITQDKEANHV